MKTRKPSKMDAHMDMDALLDEALQETFPASDPIACTPAPEAAERRTPHAAKRERNEQAPAERPTRIAP
jgi:hypothetical protein